MKNKRVWATAGVVVFLALLGLSVGVAMGAGRQAPSAAPLVRPQAEEPPLPLELATSSLGAFCIGEGSSITVISGGEHLCNKIQEFKNTLFEGHLTVQGVVRASTTAGATTMADVQASATGNGTGPRGGGSLGSVSAHGSAVITYTFRVNKTADPPGGDQGVPVRVTAKGAIKGNSLGGAHASVSIRRPGQSTLRTSASLETNRKFETDISFSVSSGSGYQITVSASCIAHTPTMKQVNPQETDSPYYFPSPTTSDCQAVADPLVSLDQQAFDEARGAFGLDSYELGKYFQLELSGNIDAPPAQPIGLTAAAGDRQVALDWTTNTDQDLAGYNVYRSITRGGPYTRLNISSVTSSDYTDSTVDNGTTHYYVVTAVDSAVGESGNSGQVSATPTVIPSLVNYQGLLRDPTSGQPVADSTYTIQFSIYAASSGGALLWRETLPVTTSGGRFNVLLGSATSLHPDLLAGAARWLGVKVGNDPEMTPRQRLVAVPYALRAGVAERLAPEAIRPGSMVEGRLEDRVSLEALGFHLMPLRRQVEGWLPTAAGPLTSAGDYTVVWTGKEMIVWGGAGGDGPGARYNPDTDLWTPITSTSFRLGHTAVWTGSDMIVWGGGRSSSQLSAEGRRYNLGTGRWTSTTITAALLADSGTPPCGRGHR